MISLIRTFAVLCLAAGMGAAGAASTDDDEDAKPWQENVVQFPAFVSHANWVPFYVSAATDNEFFVDVSTLSVDTDDVVRYVLKVVSSEGAASVSYEGMRCDTRERKIYASGRRDGSWSKSRNSAWVSIRDAAANRHYAALFLDYFCPSGIIVRSSAEAVKALQNQGRVNVRGY